MRIYWFGRFLYDITQPNSTWTRTQNLIQIWPRTWTWTQTWTQTWNQTWTRTETETKTWNLTQTRNWTRTWIKTQTCPNFLNTSKLVWICPNSCSQSPNLNPNLTWSKLMKNFHFPISNYQMRGDIVQVPFDFFILLEYTWLNTR